MKVRDILKQKGPEVITIGNEKSFAEGLNLLVNNKIGTLLVLNSEAKIVGILSERDIIKVLHSRPTDYGNLKIKDIMTEEVIVVEPEDSLDYVETIMTENRIRHLPVVHNKILVGIISIGDIVKSQLTTSRYENKYLRDYISGSYPMQ